MSASEHFIAINAWELMSLDCRGSSSERAATGDFEAKPSSLGIGFDVICPIKTCSAVAVAVLRRKSRRRKILGSPGEKAKGDLK
jgi:hypothetical protein